MKVLDKFVFVRRKWRGIINRRRWTGNLCRLKGSSRVAVEDEQSVKDIIDADLLNLQSNLIIKPMIFRLELLGLSFFFSSQGF